MGGGKDIFSSLLVTVFPKRCGFCGKVITPSADACGDCNKIVSRVQPPVCTLCGRGKEECMCKDHQCFYSKLAAPFYYEDTVRKCIWNFKFRGKTQNAKILANEMAITAEKEFSGKKFDIITCVPLTKSSLKNRGYNQGWLLAKEIGTLLNIDTVDGLLKKLYDTPAQHTMNSSMRRGNLVGVFDVIKPEMIAGRRILLCDDVATTGATLNECAKMMVLYGAKEVCCLTAAVTRKAK